MELNYFNSPVLLLNNHNKICDINTKCLDLFSYKLEEIINKNINILLENKNSLDYSDEQKCCFSLLTKDSKNNLIKLQINTEILTNKMILVIFKIENIDYSEELALIGSWRLNLKTNMISFSKEYSKLYNIKQNVMNFNEWIKKIHSLDNYQINKNETKISKKFEYCKNSKSYIEFVHKIKNDDDYLFILNKGTYKDGMIIGYSQDITETVKYKIQLENQKKIAVRESLFKTIFIANISHEIRTPINGILGLTSLLKETDTNKEQKEYIDMILDSGGVLLSLINNILEFSKIESGNITINQDTIDLKEMVNYLKKSYQERIKNKNISLNIFLDKNLPNYIKTDSVKFKQVITNLINNSIKFTQKGNIDVIIKFYTNKKNKKCIQVTVKDTGIGIPKNKIKRLFKPFSQVDESTTKEYGGTGLGLSICKKIVKLLDGNIKLFSIQNKGTSVIFEIPLMFDNDINYKKEDFITIIEDNVQNMFVIKKFTEKITDKSIITFNNGLEAVNGLKEKKPILILLDLHMPHLDGYDCALKLRNLGIKCPIIAVTANALDGVFDRCIKNGMNDIIIKPFKFEELKFKIDKWLSF